MDLPRGRDLSEILRDLKLKSHVMRRGACARVLRRCDPSLHHRHSKSLQFDEWIAHERKGIWIDLRFNNYVFQPTRQAQSRPWERFPTVLLDTTSSLSASDTARRTLRTNRNKKQNKNRNTKETLQSQDHGRSPAPNETVSPQNPPTGTFPGAGQTLFHRQRGRYRRETVSHTPFSPL